MGIRRAKRACFSCVVAHAAVSSLTALFRATNQPSMVRYLCAGPVSRSNDRKTVYAGGREGNVVMTSFLETVRLAEVEFVGDVSDGVWHDFSRFGWVGAPDDRFLGAHIRTLKVGQQVRLKM